jgi:phage gp29-like protein
MPNKNGITRDEDVATTVKKLRGLNLKTDDGLSRLGEISSELNPEKLYNIFRESEVPGDMQRLFEIYRKVEKYDGKIQGLCEKRRKAPTRFPVKVVKNYPDHPKAKEVAEALERNLKRIDLKGLMRSTVDGILWGVKLMENVWRQDSDGMIHFDNPVPISSSRYGQYNEVFGQNDPRWGKLYIRGGRSFLDRRFIDRFNPSKIFKAIYKDEKGFYDLSGILRPVIKWYLFKYFTYQYWIEYDETYGFPTTVVTIPKNDYFEYKTELESFLSNVGRNKFGILFEGMEYKVHAQQAGGQVDFFRELVKKVNDEIVFTILGHNLSEKSQQGSYASNVVGYDMDTDLIIDDAEFVDQCINENIVKHWLYFNWADLPEDFVEVHTNTPERKDWNKIKQKWELAAKLGITGVSKKQIQEELERNFAEDEEDSVDLFWQPKPNGGEHPDPQKRSEEREDGGSVADDEDRAGGSEDK